jgi:hypothetical protein
MRPTGGPHVSRDGVRILLRLHKDVAYLCALRVNNNNTKKGSTVLWMMCAAMRVPTRTVPKHNATTCVVRDDGLYRTTVVVSYYRNLYTCLFTVLVPLALNQAASALSEIITLIY